MLFIRGSEKCRHVVGLDAVVLACTPIRTRSIARHMSQGHTRRDITAFRRWWREVAAIRVARRDR